MECFCGCGRKVARFPLGVRSINKRGARIANDATQVELLLQRGMQSPNARTYVAEAREALGALATAVHESKDPGPAVESQTRELLAWGRKVPAKLGAAARRSGLSEDDALAAITRGAIDPFKS